MLASLQFAIFTSRTVSCHPVGISDRGRPVSGAAVEIASPLRGVVRTVLALLLMLGVEPEAVVVVVLLPLLLLVFFIVVDVAMLGRFSCWHMVSGREGTGKGGGTESILYVSNIFWILSPVCTLESCDLETGMNLEGWRRQLRAVRKSADINVVFCGCSQDPL